MFTMQLQDYALPGRIPGVAYALMGILAAAIVVARLHKRSKLDAIPTVGSNSWFGSWWDGYMFQKNALEIIQEGYERYKSVPFKVADRYDWIVILSGRQHVEELRQVPEDELSFHSAMNDLVQTEYTLGPELLNTRYHVDVIRSQLTRSLTFLHPEIRDEVSVTFDEVLDLKDSEWKSVPVLSTIQKVVCRTSNRLFVGLPLCRDPDWVDINLRYTRDVVDGATEIRLFPSFFAPFVAYFMTNVPGTTKRAMKHLAPIIEEQLKLREEHGDEWAEKPHDLLTWLMDEIPEPERTTKLLTLLVLVTNFGAIHTTSNSFYQVLFFLAENPQYIRPLREEVESIVEKEGWSKASLGKMRKIDSFMRESQRMVGNGIVSLRRKAAKNYRFSDGTFIPKGTTIVTPSRCVHHDDQYYDSPQVFSPFRFSDMREEKGEGTKHHFVSTSMEYLPFGHGRNACPGRFFAAHELKTMLAHVVISYDVKLEDDKTRRPASLRKGLRVAPDPASKVMFRKRVH